MNHTPKITRLPAPRNIVGEGPLWDATGQALFCVDMIGKRVMRIDARTEAVRAWQAPGLIGSMALRPKSTMGGGAILALPDGIYTLDFESGEITPHAAPATPDPRVQLNDGKVDRRGRFIVGATDSKMKEPIGDVYSLEHGRLRVIDRGICISNGPCWSPDDRTFYFADSLANEIYTYEYDISTGDVANRRVFANTADLGGIPDGATIDADGLLWSAICEGGKIACFRPDGKIERIIETPVKLPSSVMFGGEKLDRLFFTSIDPGVFGRPNNDDDGYTFVIDGLGVRGLPEPLYEG